MQHYSESANKYNQINSQQYKLISKIIKLSDAKTWDQAKLEWKLDNTYINEDYETCLCGHYPIKEICVLHNTSNFNKSKVGNCCVNKFLEINTKTIFESFKKISKDISKALNQQTIEYVYNKNWINNWEYKFYLNNWRKRNLSPKVITIRTKINTKILNYFNNQKAN